MSQTATTLSPPPSEKSVGLTPSGATPNSAATPVPTASPSAGTPPGTTPPATITTTTTRQKYVAECCLDLLHTEVVDYVTNSEKFVGRPDKIYNTIEDMGFKAGLRLCERLTRDKPRFTDNINIEIVKFICKEFWQEAFKKQIDNLKTNHKGTYVLHEKSFRYLTKISSSNLETTTDQAQFYVTFSCGIIRGALSCLGIEAIVTADISKLPSCLFKIQERA